MKKLTAAHVTHEAAEKIGGIGTVLEGVISSPVYQEHVERTILVGPLGNYLEFDPLDRLGPDGTVLYSGPDDYDEVGLNARLQPIEWAFDVRMVYGTRQFTVPGDSRIGEAEILLIDVFKMNQDRLNRFKFQLHEYLGIDSHRYESDWGFEEYVRLALPAYHALLVLLRRDQLPCLLFSHEFMGLPTAFKAELDGGGLFRTIFHAHECSTARRLVEGHTGHDTRFYNILRQARAENRCVDEVMGDQSDSFRHALISRAHMCDAIFAVGDYTAEEIHFLGCHFDHHHIDLVYNGVPATDITFEERNTSRTMLLDYSESLFGWRPDVLMTHVTRPVVSKGLWRDAQVCHELDSRFEACGLKGVLYILTSAGGTRRSRDVHIMEEEYGWPAAHREGFPDLVGPEVDLFHMVEAFNAEHQNIRLVLVNQFGWSRDLIGTRVPEDMDFADLRRATDIEFGMATYEPFGISPLEPLGSGAICVISSVCGCEGFVEDVTGGKGVANVISADFTALDEPRSIEQLLNMSQGEREAIEARVCADTADEIMRRLPTDDAARRAMLQSGQSIVHRLGWDAVLEKTMIPTLQRIMATAEEPPKARVAERAPAIKF